MAEKDELMNDGRNNELNDIILNQGGKNSNVKKFALLAAVLGVVFIIVIVVMNSMNSNTSNLPQAVLPPEPKQAQSVENDPLFEPVPVISQAEEKTDKIDKIAKKLKEQSIEEEKVTVDAPIVEAEISPEPLPVIEKAPEATKLTPTKMPSKTTAMQTATSGTYIQVGSFTRLKPNKELMQKISKNGYSSFTHEVIINGKKIKKLLVGPYNGRKGALQDIENVRRLIEKQAFILKV